MIKKFFVALLLALLVISSQIAAAADDIDWNSAPGISSISDFVRYINRERRNGKTSFNVVLTNGITISQKGFLYLIPSVIVSTPQIYSNNGENIFVTYKIKEYPSTRVLNAYRNNDLSNLTNDEMQLYNEIVKIIKEAKK